MQLAIVAAGFSPGEADRLRRSMAAWRRKGGLEQFRSRLIDGMKERGYSIKFAEQIYKQICGFGEYGFPESHSASFALLAYVSAWLKHYEPAAFLAAMLNSQPMGFYSSSVLVQDARRHGVEVLPVDVTVSDWECTLESGVTSHGARVTNNLSPVSRHSTAASEPATREILRTSRPPGASPGVRPLSGGRSLGRSGRGATRGYSVICGLPRPFPHHSSRAESGAHPRKTGPLFRPSTRSPSPAGSPSRTAHGKGTAASRSRAHRHRARRSTFCKR